MTTERKILKIAVTLLTLVLLWGQPHALLAQQQGNVVTIEVTEPGFLMFDGKSVFDAEFRSVKGAPLVVEPYSVRGAAGPLARYYVHGLTGENVIVSAPDHEDKVVSTAGQTFVDVWLYRTKSSPYPTSSRYWQGPTTPSLTATAATLFRDNADLFMASSDFTSGRIAISRVDRAPVFTAETSTTGAGLTAFKDGRMYLAWQGTGNRLVNVMSSANGSQWEGKRTFRDTTLARPAIAGGEQQLALVWTGLDHRLNLMFSDGVVWGPKYTLAYRSDASPAAMWVRDSLYIAWFASGSKTLQVARWRNHALERVGSADTSDDAPSLSMLNGNLTLSWTGTRNLLVNTMSVDTYQFGLGNKQTFALTSDRTPTVLSYRWSGARDRGVALPLFITSHGLANTAERYWSDLRSTPDVQAQGVLYPSYVVASIIYAPPGTAVSGAKNTIEYGEKSGLGTSLTIAESFKYEHKFTATAGFGGDKSPNGSVSAGYGLTASTQDQETTEVRLSTSTTSKYTGPSIDGVDHDRDIIVLWLNPQVTVSLTSSDTRWDLAPRQGQSAWLLRVYVGWLKHPELMPDGVVNALKQAGIGADEYAEILKHSPFALTDAPTLDPARFWRANTTFPYEPPPAPGAVPPSLVFTQSTLSIHSSSRTSEDSYSVGLTLSAGFNLDIVKISLKDDQTWTWTSKVSRNTSETSEQTVTLNLTGPSYGYSGPTTFEIYWDSLYRAFVFVPYEPWRDTDFTGSMKTTDTDTGVSGTIYRADGSPAAWAEVLLRSADGTRLRTITTSSGFFDFPRAKAGAAVVSVGTEKVPVTGGMSGVVISLQH